jgi:CRISPR-associated endonuclease/helicase Cas3
VQAAVEAEPRRVRYERIEGRLDAAVLVERVLKENGPRLVILNTVQSAAVVAKRMRDEAGAGNVLHLSTALAPRDREAILERVKDRLAGDAGEFTLVATSCVEAGVDLSFRVGFRERCSAASLIQTGGRVNRHGEREAGTVFSFALADHPPLTRHPSFARSAEVLDALFEEGLLNHHDPAAVVTEAMTREMKDRGGPGKDHLGEAEAGRDYPRVADLGRVIRADTRVVVVDEALKERLRDRWAGRSKRSVPFRDLLAGSVQLWATKIDKLGMEPAGPTDDLYFWGDDYDEEFLGVMAGVLKTAAFFAEGGTVI